LFEFVRIGIFIQSLKKQIKNRKKQKKEKKEETTWAAAHWPRLVRVTAVRGDRKAKWAQPNNQSLLSGGVRPNAETPL
jgi:hypothetical protein